MDYPEATRYVGVLLRLEPYFCKNHANSDKKRLSQRIVEIPDG
jgi:hypothetical protein